MIIGITGTSGAGKGTAVEYLKEKGFSHYSVSDYLREYLQKQKREINRINLQDIGNELRKKHEPEYVVKKLFLKAKKESANSIIESVRNPKEAEFLKQNGAILIAVEAKLETRYKRIKKRASDKDFVTLKEFKAQEQREFQNSDKNSQNIPECIKLSDFKVDNNGSVKKLQIQIDKLINTKKR